MIGAMKEYRCPSCGAPKPRAGTCRCLYCETVSDCRGQALTETEAEMREYYDFDLLTEVRNSWSCEETTLLSNMAPLQFYGYSAIKDMKHRTEAIGRMMFA